MIAAHRVLTLSGFGLKARVERGHLLIEDGAYFERTEMRLPRVRHGLRRLVVIGSDGFITLSALRWLAEQNAAFVMLNRNGTVLAVVGPTSPGDARLRRAQHKASESGLALRIVQELVARKLQGQESIANEMLNWPDLAALISQLRSLLSDAQSIDHLRALESQAASAYWDAWHNIPVTWSRADEKKVPEHWRTFGTRISPLSGSPRKAVNPANAILNYLYAVLESEACIAATACGLDPGLGLYHLDSRTRDSLACDLMEPCRPLVDAYVLDWVKSAPLARRWFFEIGNGACRLMTPFAVELGKTAPAWGSAVRPAAEWVAHEIEKTIPKASRTRSHPISSLPSSRKPLSACRECGASTSPSRTYCATCAPGIERSRLLAAARLGRAASHAPQAEAKRMRTQRRHRAAEKSWQEQGTSLDYARDILPGLNRARLRDIASTLGVSKGYASAIRQGLRVPHARHWDALRRL